MDLELQQNHQHVMEALRHMHDSTHEKLNLILKKLGAEEQEIMEQQDKWFHEIAFQAAKIYGEEHDLTKHFMEEYKLETGKEWEQKEPSRKNISSQESQEL